ncbi:MAG: FIST N-terminal domain-containing protein [Phycisphaerae bacterium]|jgi:hypothetical protein
MSLDFRSAWTDVENTRAALDELREQIAQPSPACVFYYCSPTYDLDQLARALTEAYDCPILACTTAGEIVPGHGYVHNGIAAASLGSPHLNVVQESIKDVRALDSMAAQQMKIRLLDKLGGACPANETRFGILLIDGLCGWEEIVAANVYGALAGVPIVGGSAGEPGGLNETRVLVDGQFRTNAATLTVVQTSLPCTIFKSDHFESTETRFVVTGADTEKRLILEIDGMNPADFYVEHTGITPDAFNLTLAARHPLLLPVGGDHYARSVHHAEPNGSLAMFCAIEEGIVMRLGRCLDIVGEADQQRRAIQALLPKHRVTLGFDCILRRLEVLDRDVREPMRQVIDDMKLFAFNTYGEQYNGLHVNQTLTGVALGAPT